jgi:hypothetical protein
MFEQLVLTVSGDAKHTIVLRTFFFDSDIEPLRTEIFRCHSHADVFTCWLFTGGGRASGVWQSN